MNLPDGKVVLVNNTLARLAGVDVRAEIFTAEGQSFWKKVARIDAPANAATDVLDVQWPAFPGLYFLKLAAADAAHNVLSENFYWHVPKDSDMQALNVLPATALRMEAKILPGQDQPTLMVAISNPGNCVALQAAVTLRDAASGERILPVFYSDNYFSLLPGEEKAVRIQATKGLDPSHWKVTVRGWNVKPGEAR
jgi:hypothetical protein